MASISKRLAFVFKAKANKALDRAEDPRETLDYSYQKQLEMLQKVKRGVADVATSRKRLELQMNQLQASGDKLQTQAQAGAEPEPRGPRPRGADPPLGPAAAARRPLGPARPAAGRGGEAHQRGAAALDQGRVVPHPQGDDQGDLHGRRGADQDRRGVLRHLRGDERRRPGHAARRGQDRADAGTRRRHRRADGLRAPSRTTASAPAGVATTSRSSSTGCPRPTTSSSSWPG